MIPKYFACAFAAITLAGCCASGTTCEAPIAASNVAWDGLGPAPNDIAPAKKKTVSRPRNEVALQPKAEPPTDNKLRAKDVWETEAEDQADDARLAKKLKICSGCSMPAGVGQHPRRQNESNQMDADVKNGAGVQELRGASAVSLRDRGNCPGSEVQHGDQHGPGCRRFARAVRRIALQRRL